MKKNLLTILLLASTFLIHAQTVSEIKTSGDYLFGEGWSENYSEADRQALRNLVESISVNVESSFSNVVNNVTLPDGTPTTKTAMQAVMRTYSQATLTNTKVITISPEPDAHVLRYVSIKDVAKIFQARKEKTLDFINLAQKAEEKLKIDDALRYYYWAYCMLTSLPDTIQPKASDNKTLLRTWIPDQINEVFSGIKAEKQEVDGDFITINVTYHDQPVTSLDYTYFDGQSYTNIYSAANGIGFMEMLPGVSPEKLQIKCEYAYLGEAQIDKEIASVVEVMKGQNFRNAYINVTEGRAYNKSKSTATANTNSKAPATHSPADCGLTTVTNASELSSFNDIMDKIKAAIKSKNFNSVDSYFTPEGKDMFHKLLHYGNARILEEPELVYIRKGDETICRSIPMSFSFKNNTRKFVESVSFTFDANKKINCVAFGLGELAQSDIEKRTDYSEMARVILTQFLENYKTAFALKRLDYIESIFDDNALIITGTVVKKTNYQNKEEQTRFLDNKIIKYNRFSKNEYIKHLERSFKSNEFINIRFANNDVVKAGGTFGEVYGIQIRQDYYSTNYGDTGYLFLYVDLNDPSNPIIKVRTWQPERDPNFGLYGLGDF